MITSSVTNITGALSQKRSFGVCVQIIKKSSSEIDTLFEMVANSDFREATSISSAIMVKSTSELVDIEVVLRERRLFLAATMAPVSGGTQCTLEFLTTVPTVVCMVEADLRESSGGCW